MTRAQTRDAADAASAAKGVFTLLLSRWLAMGVAGPSGRELRELAEKKAERANLTKRVLEAIKQITWSDLVKRAKQQREELIVRLSKLDWKAKAKQIRDARDRLQDRMAEARQRQLEKKKSR